jgi:hypothetical protein
MRLANSLNVAACAAKLPNSTAITIPDKSDLVMLISRKFV